MVFTKISLLFSLFSFSLSYQDSNTITLQIPNLAHTNGKIYVQVLDDNQKPIKETIVAIHQKNFSFRLENIQTNNPIAIKVFHDENNNGKLDTGWLGIPTEGWGVSNNVKAIMGPPSFQKMLFNPAKIKTVSIQLHY
jgi:uncharacterized protein (DUF2141 family)